MILILYDEDDNITPHMISYQLHEDLSYFTGDWISRMWLYCDEDDDFDSSIIDYSRVYRSSHKMMWAFYGDSITVFYK